MKPYITTLVFGVLAFSSACADVEPVKAPVDMPARIYVANESSNDVSVIDATNFQPVGTIDPKNQSTHDLAVNRDGRRLYATNLASGRFVGYRHGWHGNDRVDLYWTTLSRRRAHE